MSPNLRRSTRKRRIPVGLEEFTDSSGTEDNDLMVRFYILKQMQYLYRTMLLNDWVCKVSKLLIYIDDFWFHLIEVLYLFSLDA